MKTWKLQRQKCGKCSGEQTEKDPTFCLACIFWTYILCHAQLQVRLGSTSSTITYGKEYFKAMLLPP